MIRHTLQSQLEPVLTDYLESLPGYFDNSEANGGSNPLDNCRLERPRHKDHGDYAINVSSLAKWAKAAPPAIAEALKNQLSGALPDTQFQTSMAAGFLNFTVQQPLLANTLLSLVQSKSPGKNQAMANISMLLEYVSANPTGPLHIGHGRWAALGNSIQRILEHCGATVTPEFYVNDAGVQMNNIAGSLWYRSLEILGTGGKLPEPVEGEKYPFYPGEYVIEMAQDYLADDTNKDKIIAWDQAATNHTPPEEALADLIAYAKKSMLAEQKALLDKCGVPFENWFSEKEYLHERGLVEEGLEKLK
nr:arginine--tRNA ligase [Vampirovibrio sp.]